eukprot:CAMPEP_0181433382 /NCGR_PEP_ID=MMETSP1110-20121109/19261_1 /TAXON_ID=174948 /ORGANISM="Symbiodinium sp., Strain CCMP421" /LENGTH=590 /DNA_ID=CAMNT_0023556829 /DNA_START=37 /DNA_END=1806 /DNA_ORIENTATION=-
MPGPAVPQFASLYVGDLHPDVTEAMLYEIFNAVGPVASIRVCRDSVTRKSLGYGYVNFHSVSDAERALDTLNYSTIRGRSCRLMWSQRDPTLRKNGAGNIYVSNLDPNIDNKALYDTFSLFGNILSCKVASDNTGKSHGYGFVHYESETAARQAIEQLNGMQIGEKQVTVCLFQKKDKDAEKENYTNLYVKYYPQDWDEAKLMEFFSQVGPVTAAAVRGDDKGRKFAFVNFENTDDAKKCVADMHMMDLRDDKDQDPEPDADGHPVGHLYVKRAQTKKERQAELRSKFSEAKRGSNAVNLYVKNLDASVDDAALRELFEPFGKVSSASAVKDPTGKCKGFGFVAFATSDAATKAVTEMHLKVVKGKPLYVGLAERKEARQERLRQKFTPGFGFDNFGYGGGCGGGCFGKGKKGGKGKGGGKDFGHEMMDGPQNMMMGMPGMGMPMGGMMRPMMGMMQPQGMQKGPPNPMHQMMGPGMGKGGMPTMPMGHMGPVGMMRPPMPQMPMMRPNAPTMPVNLSTQIASVSGPVQKQLIGEKLYPLVSKYQPELAGKITGMMLEMDNSELLLLLESEPQLRGKVDEALRVIQSASR